MMLGRLGRLCSDAVILQRIVPMLLVAMEDASASVRVTAIRAATKLLSLVTSFEPIEMNYFPQYVFPAMNRLCKDSDLLVRMTFAECMGSIANSAKRFLDISQWLAIQKTLSEARLVPGIDVTKVPIEFPYHSKLDHLKECVARWLRDLLTDASMVNMSMAMINMSGSGGGSGSAMDATRRARSVLSLESAVKKVILSHIMELSIFFGQESAMDKLLTQLLTFLNDQVWQ